MFTLKRSLILAAGMMIGSTLSSCETISEITPKDSGTVSVKSYELYTISKGGHYSDKNPYKALRTNSIKFEVVFDSSAIYTTLAPGNQEDINKLFGLSDCNTSHHTNSARFGWRWLNNQLEILAYTYLNKEWEYKFIGTVTLGEAANCELMLEDDRYVFKLNDKEVTLPRACNGEGIGYQLYPYFGGDEVAPHDILIRIKEVQ